MRANYVSLTVWLLLHIIQLNLALAQATSTANVLPFRREFVPEEIVAREAKGMIPVRREEFESLLLETRAHLEQASPEAWIQSSEANLKLNGSTLAGQVRFTIRRKNADQVLLPLGELNLTVQEAHWESETNERVVMGRTAAGQAYALIDRDGVLAFNGSVSGGRDPWGVFAFDIHLPEASHHAWSISLPEQAKLSASTGVVETKTALNGESHWTWQSSGAIDSRWRIFPAGAQVAEPIALLREETTCLARDSELEVNCLLKLDVYREPLRQMELTLIGDWAPLSVRSGTRRVPFQIIKEANRSRLLLEFDPPLVGTNRRIAITGRSTWQENTLLTAPRVEAPLAHWLEGSFNLQVTDEHEVAQWQPTQTHWKTPTSKPTPEAVASEARKFAWDFERSDAKLQFALRKKTPPTQIAQGTSLRFTKEAIQAKMVLDCTADNTGVFQWEGFITPSWFVDSITTEPADLLETWEQIPRGKQQLARVTLRRSPTMKSPVRLVVNAHREPLDARGLHGDGLSPIQWLTKQFTGSTTLAIGSQNQVHLLHDALLKPLERTQLTLAESNRLEFSDETWLTARDAALTAVTLMPANDAPQFQAEIKIGLHSAGHRWRQSAHVRIMPEDAALDRVRIAVRPALDAAITWRAVNNDALSFTARRLNSNDHPMNQDEWEIQLARPRREPWEIVGEWFVDLNQNIPSTTVRTPVHLLACPEANTQTGIISLSSQPAAWLLPERMTGLLPLATQHASGTLVRSWSYDPAQQAALELRPNTKQEISPLLFVQSAALTTRVQTGQLSHEMVYQIIAVPGSHFEAMIAPEAELQAVFVNGKSIATHRGTDPRRLKIPLGDSSAVQVVKLQYARAMTPGINSWSVSPLWPIIETTPARLEWNVVAPANYRILHPSTESALTPWERLQTWLFQPLPGFSASQSTTPNASWEGCRVLQFNNVAGLPTQLICLREEMFIATAWLAFVLIWSLVVVARRHSTLVTTCCVAICGGLFFFLPSSVNPVGIMCWLGMMLGLVSPITLRSERRLPQDRSTTYLWRWFAALGMVLMMISQTHAQERTASKPVVQRVIIPVDAKGAPQGDYVFINEKFFTELHTLARKRQRNGPDILFTRAKYQATVNQEHPTHWESLHAEIELEALRSPVRAFIPWPREGVHISSERLRLNGRPTTLDWADDGSGFYLELSTRGKQQLEFISQPTARGATNPQRLKVQFPPTLNTQVSWDVPAQVTVHVSPRESQTELQAMEKSRTISLANAREVILTARLIEEINDTSAEQLLWSRAWPGGSVVEGKWKFTRTEGLFESVHVECDNSWQLLNAAADTPAQVRLQSDAGHATLNWLLDAPTAEITVKALFYVPFVPSEPWQLSNIEPHATRVVRSWGALSIAESSPLRSVAIPANEFSDTHLFATAWNSEEVPQFVRQITKGNKTLLAEIPPREPLNATTTVRIEATPEQLRWKFAASITNFAKSVSLIIPKGALIEQVQWQTEQDTVDLPWLAISDTELAIALPTSFMPGTLQVNGTEKLLFDVSRKISLPTLMHAVPRESRIECWRSPEIELDVQKSDQLTIRELPKLSQVDPSALIAVGAWTTPTMPSPTPIQLEWLAKANRPEIQGLFITSVHEIDQEWHCRYEGDFQITHGQLDSLRLQWNGNWNEPKLISGNVTIKPIVNAGRRQLLLQLHPDESDRVRFTLEATRAGNSSALEVPNIHPLDFPGQQEYLRVPTGANYRWSINGVQESPLPMNVPAEQDAGRSLSYRVIAARHSVELLENSSEADMPRVLLEEFHNQLRADGSQLGLVNWWITPAGATACPVHLPADCQVLQATVDGSPVALQQGKTNASLPLASAVYPQWIQLRYIVPRVSHVRPTPGDWIVDERLEISANQFAAMLRNRIEVLLASTSEAMSASSDNSAEQNIWSRNWHEYLAATHEAWLALQTDEPLTNEVNAMLRELEALSNDPQHEDGSKLVSTQLIQALAEVNSPDRFIAVEPIVDYPAWRFLLRTAMGCVWISLVVGVSWLTGQSLVREIGRRYAFLGFALLGVLLMMLVSPFWIGGFLSLTAALGMLTWPWRESRH